MQRQRATPPILSERVTWVLCVVRFYYMHACMSRAALVQNMIYELACHNACGKWLHSKVLHCLEKLRPELIGWCDPRFSRLDVFDAFCDLVYLVE